MSRVGPSGGGGGGGAPVSFPPASLGRDFPGRGKAGKEREV